MWLARKIPRCHGDECIAGPGPGQQEDSLEEIFVTRKLELSACFVEDIDHIRPRSDFDFGSPQVRGQDLDVSRHVCDRICLNKGAAVRKDFLSIYGESTLEFLCLQGI